MLLAPMDTYSIDTHKLAYHPDRVADLMSARNDPEKYLNLKPIYAEISTSGACNHRCTFCSVDYIGYKSVFISYDTLNAFFESSRIIGLKSVMFAGDGEPFLHPNICDIISAANKNFIDVSFTTNAVHLKRTIVDRSLSNITWIKASVNAGTADAYAAIHRTSSNDFTKVWSNLRYAVKSRDNTISRDSRTAIGVQSLILPDNLHTLDELASRSVDCGLDYLVLKPYVHNVYMQQPGYSDIDYTQAIYLDNVSKLSQKYNSTSFSVVSRFNALKKLSGDEQRYATCWSTPALWFYISGNGDVYACGAHVGNPHFLLGNINQTSIQSIWQSKKRLGCFDYVQNELNLETCRRTCRMDEANKYLDNLMNDSFPHRNFI